MKIGIWNNYAVFAKNRIFDAGAYKIGEDLGYPIRYLRDRLRALGHELSTLDTAPLSAFDRAILLDYPEDARFSPGMLKASGVPAYLFMTEVEIVNPRAYNPKLWSEFRKVFTYDRNLAHAPMVIEYDLPHKLQPVAACIEKGWSDRAMLATMIAGDKSSTDHRELYSERRKVIDWYEQNAPGDFDLYGTGWGRRRFSGPRILRALNRIDFLTKALGEARPSYRGLVDSKAETLSQYRFSYCFENAQGIPGYITEKLFDCLCAGCVPIYRGAPDIRERVDPDCYVDAREFAGVRELHDHISRMPRSSWERMRDAALRFLLGDGSKPFSAEVYAARIVDEIVGDEGVDGRR